MKLFTIFITILLAFSNLQAQETNYIETNGVKIYYETHGTGEPLLLIHGGGLSHLAWSLWIEDLSDDYMLIIPDLRGHGRSTNPSGIISKKSHAIDMMGLMDSLGIGRFKAMGHSAGALTLIHMATMDTSRLSSMILISGAPYYTSEYRQFINNSTYEGIAQWMKPHHQGGEQQIRELINSLKPAARSYDDMNFTPPYLSQILCPTLIIHGDRDSIFPIDSPVSLYKSIPNAYLWVVPNEGHDPIGIYDRQSVWSNVFFQVMKDFFAGNWN